MKKLIHGLIKRWSRIKGPRDLHLFLFHMAPNLQVAWGQTPLWAWSFYAPVQTLPIGTVHCSCVCSDGVSKLCCWILRKKPQLNSSKVALLFVSHGCGLIVRMGDKLGKECQTGLKAWVNHSDAIVHGFEWAWTEWSWSIGII